MESKRGHEDYLRTILELIKKKDEDKKEVRSIEIAKSLKISKPSVSEMLNKMKNKGLIKFEPYSKVNLTGKGKRIAEKVSEKHKIIKTFAQKLGHKSPHKEAHNLEHALSEEMISKISDLLYRKTNLENPPSYIS
ncbi:MAG: metal-dependent transcriptional regulator [Nanoarchaeota archaeon]